MAGMSALKIFTVQPQYSGIDYDGWHHSAQGSILPTIAEDAGQAARMLSNHAFGLMGHRWTVKHCYALVHEAAMPDNPRDGLALMDAGMWVRVSYRYGGIETVCGRTYAEVKYMETENDRG